MFQTTNQYLNSIVLCRKINATEKMSASRGGVKNMIFNQFLSAWELGKQMMVHKYKAWDLGKNIVLHMGTGKQHDAKPKKT